MAQQIALIVLAVLLCVPLSVGLWFLFSGLAVPRGKEYDAPSAYYRCVVNAGVLVCRLGLRMKVTLEGAEKLPADGRYLMVGNHISAFDPFAVLIALRKENMIFISKPENMAIPIVGPILRRCCFLSIDRDNPRNAVSTIRRASELIVSGAGPVMVYPEGTRSRTGELLPFHNGVFKIAQSANVPVVVTTVVGTERVRSRAPFRSTRIRLRICEVLPAEEISSARTNVIGERVRAIMTENL